MIMKLHRYIDHDSQMTPIDFQVTRYIVHDSQMTPIDFQVTRSKVKVTGVNKLGQMLKAMAKDAGFLKHKRITNHSVRKFLVKKLRNANIPPTETMAITGQKMSSP
ncbi:hypothetical protein DPMN_122921 [Dreissena polymorpha]|uniref:Uncharacterized protein n=1 Tax=Dreissena polymorpha TaxID=45954 RepID=A0A9D4GPD7_DREPO|nr:hypothetical protein DPMN_122921 [Dreissena polymorpha]